MQDKDYVVIGGIALVIWLLCKSAQGGGAGTSKGAGCGGAGNGCGCSGSPQASINPWTGGVRPGCLSASPGFGNWSQGNGPYPPEAFTTYNPPSSEAWDSSGFHLGFDLSIVL